MAQRKCKNIHFCQWRDCGYVLYEATDSFEDQLEHENSTGNDAGGQQKQFD